MIEDQNVRLDKRDNTGEEAINIVIPMRGLVAFSRKAAGLMSRISGRGLRSRRSLLQLPFSSLPFFFVL
jgi:hypothetical protein